MILLSSDIDRCKIELAVRPLKRDGILSSSEYLEHQNVLGQILANVMRQILAHGYLWGAPTERFAGLYEKNLRFQQFEPSSRTQGLSS